MTTMRFATGLKITGDAATWKGKFVVKVERPLSTNEHGDPVMFYAERYRHAARTPRSDRTDALFWTGEYKHFREARILDDGALEVGRRLNRPWPEW